MKSVLVIDDDPVFRSAVSSQLNEPHYKVFEAENPDNGMHLLKNNRVDLILMDLILKGKGVIEVLIQIREDYPDMPCIIATDSVYSDSDALGNLLNRFGVVSILKKPVGENELLEAVSRVK